MKTHYLVWVNEDGTTHRIDGSASEVIELFEKISKMRHCVYSHYAPMMGQWLDRYVRLE